MNVLLIKYGEIFIKKGNKSRFENRLINLIHERLGNDENYYIVKEQGRFILEHENIDFDYVISRLKNISGINSLCKAIKIENPTVEILREISLKHMKEKHKENISFKVEVRRSDKNFPLDSLELAHDVGGYLFNNLDNLKVDVKTPDIKLKIEIRTNTYIYSEEVKGLSGLPYGSSGKAVLLLSGGIDSPVAGFLMGKRGVAFECIYFHSPPYTSLKALQKVKDLSDKLFEYTGEMTLNVVNFTDVMVYIKNKVPENKMTIFLKRSMLKAGGIIAEKRKALGIIVGDSIGQVASQTMENIYVMDSSVSMPILRPLCGMDKNEIIKIAKEIETYEISIRPYDDCCTVFVPEHPDLKPNKRFVERVENNMTELDFLINKAIDEMDIQTNATN